MQQLLDITQSKQQIADLVGRVGEVQAKIHELRERARARVQPDAASAC